LTKKERPTEANAIASLRTSSGNLGRFTAISSKPMKPARLAKATALAFALGAILSVASDPNILHQAEAIAIAKAQAIATSAMRSLGSRLEHWLEQGVEGGLKGIVKQVSHSK
jgi:hypothetical protein